MLNTKKSTFEIMKFATDVLPTFAYRIAVRDLHVYVCKSMMRIGFLVLVIMSV